MSSTASPGTRLTGYWKQISLSATPFLSAMKRHSTTNLTWNQRRILKSSHAAKTFNLTLISRARTKKLDVLNEH